MRVGLEVVGVGQAPAVRIRLRLLDPIGDAELLGEGDGLLLACRTDILIWMSVSVELVQPISGSISRATVRSYSSIQVLVRAWPDEVAPLAGL